MDNNNKYWLKFYIYFPFPGETPRLRLAEAPIQFSNLQFGFQGRSATYSPNDFIHKIQSLPITTEKPTLILRMLNSDNKKETCFIVNFSKELESRRNFCGEIELFCHLDTYLNKIEVTKEGQKA